MSTPTHASTAGTTSTTNSLVDFRAREEQLRRLDAELNEKKKDVVRRAEELVKAQSERLAKMDAGQPPYSPTRAASGSVQYHNPIDYHRFDANEQGFLDETTGYRGRIETTTGGTTSGLGSRTRPTSGVPSASSTASSAAARNYARPMSAATMEGRRRSSGIPTTAAGSSVASGSRITPSNLAIATPASQPQSSTASQYHPSRYESSDAVQDSTTGGQTDDGEAMIGAEDAGLDGLEGLPATAMGSAATIRFQKAKIQALTTSVTTLTTSLAAKDKELLDLKLLVKNGNDSREKLLRAKEALEKASSGSVKQVQELETKLAHTEGEAQTLRREQVAWEKKRKEYEAEMKTKDTKVNRVVSEMERLKEQLARMKSGGGAGGGGGVLNEETKRELENLRLTNKKLLQQRLDLLAGFKKQHKLIEILKKQKLHMELAKMLNFTEEEFAKSLEMGEI